MALAAVLATFWFLGGFWGAVGWLVVATIWALFPPIVAVAAGHFVLVALTPSEAGLERILLGVAAVSGLLVADLAALPSPGTDILTFGGSVAIVGTGLILLEQTAGLLAAGITVVVLLGAGSYLCHRYLLLALGLVADEPTTTRTNRSEGPETE